MVRPSKPKRDEGSTHSHRALAGSFAPHNLDQSLINSALPTRPAKLEMIDHFRAQSDRNGLLGRRLIQSSYSAQFRKYFMEGTGFREVFLRPLGIVADCAHVARGIALGRALLSG